MSKAERIVTALTNRPEAKDADGDYNFVLDRQQMIDVVEKQLRLAREREWISVEDRLPEHSTPVLIFGRLDEASGHRIFSGIVNKAIEPNHWHSLGRGIIDVTHWMPLPPNPPTP